jgi:predicted TIM-barrel fold metal-dependent hydrolase
MRTIAIEEHFVAQGVRDVMQRTAASQGGGAQPTPTVTMTAERQRQLADLDTLRLQEMDAAGIDLQVLSNVGSVVGAGGAAPHAAEEEVQLARAANDQLARACTTHPTRFAGFATLPMSLPESAA